MSFQRKPCIFNWSGGKDSSLALYHCLNDPTLDIKYLVTTLNAGVNRVSMHGVREELIIRQAEAIGIPLYPIRLPETPGILQYEQTMKYHLQKFKEIGIKHAIYGDIFLEEVKKYREDKLSEMGLTGIFPLWKRETSEVMSEFLDLGFKTVIVCAQDKIEQFVGRVIDSDIMRDLPADIDICGENGEYHTFAFEGPIFKRPLRFRLGEKIFKEFPKPKGEKDACFSDTKTELKSGYWYIDIF